MKGETVHVLTELDGMHVATVWVFANQEDAQDTWDEWWTVEIGHFPFTEEEREAARSGNMDYDLYWHEEVVG